MTAGCAGPDLEHDWLDTWKSMEKLYEAHPDKLKAIGKYFVLAHFLVCLSLSRCLQLLGPLLGEAAQGGQGHPCCQPDRVAPLLHSDRSCGVLQEQGHSFDLVFSIGIR